MKFSYFPGCSLEGTAREYHESLGAVCQCLDIELKELDDWNCCGATSAHVTEEALSINLPARNLYMAQGKGWDLMVPCAACYNRLKTTEKKLLDGHVSDIDFLYRGDIKILYPLAIFTEKSVLDCFTAKVAKLLKGLNVVCYYGCLTVRPPDIIRYKDYENPREMDELLALMGANVCSWPYKTECCGGSLTMTRRDIVLTLVERLISMASEAGADCIVTGCPMCQTNLDIGQIESLHQGKESQGMPIFYFSELMALALGHRDVTNWLKRHIVDPGELLSSKGLI